MFHAGGRADGRTDITKLTVALRNYANTPEITVDRERKVFLYFVWLSQRTVTHVHNNIKCYASCSVKQKIEHLSNAYPNFALKKDDQSSGVPYSINNCNLLRDAVNKLRLEYFYDRAQVTAKVVCIYAMEEK